MGTAISDFVASGAFRRIVATLVGIALPSLNAWLAKYLDIQIPAEGTVAAIGAIAVYVAQSMIHEKHGDQIAADAAAQVNTVDDAIAVLNNAPPAVSPVTVNVGPK